MSNFYSSTPGTESPLRKRSNALNADLVKIIEESDKRREAAQIAAAGQQSLKKMLDAQDALESQKTKTAAQQVLDTANISPEEEKSFMGKIGDILDLPSKHISRPLMAGVLANTYRLLPGEQAGEQELRKAAGWNPFGILTEGRRERLRDALEETELPFGVYTAMEFALDPLNLLGVGVVSKGTRAAVGLDKALAAGKIFDSPIELSKAQKFVKGVTSAPTGKKFIPAVGLRAPIRTAAEKIDDKVREDLGASTEKTVLPRMTKDMDDRVSTVLPENKLRKLGERIGRTPGLRQVTGVVNPSVLATTKIGRLLLGRGILMEDADRIATIAASRLSGTPARIITDNLDDTGRMTLGNGGKIAWGDLFEELPEAISKRVDAGELTTEQAVYILDYQTYIDDSIRMLIDEGHGKLVRHLKIGKGKTIDGVVVKDGNKYIPRYATDSEMLGKMKLHQRGAAAGFGEIKPNTFDFSRYHDTMEDGIQSAVKYLGPEELLTQHLKASYRTIAELKVNKKLRELPGVIAKTTLAQATRAKTATAGLKVNAGTKLIKTLTTLQTDGKLTGSQLLVLRDAMKKKGLEGDEELINYLSQVESMLKGRPRGPVDKNAVYELNKNKKKALDNLIEEINAPANAADKAKSGFKARVAQDLDAAKKELAEEEKIEKVKKGLEELDGHKGFLFPSEIVKAVKASKSSEEANGFVKGLADMNSFSRMAATGFDIGAGFLQGLPLLVTNPAGWVRAQKFVLESLKDPDAFANYIAKHEQTLIEMGQPINLNEFVEVWQRANTGTSNIARAQRFLREKPNVVIGGKRVGGATVGATGDYAARAFTAFGLAARVEMYEALRPMALRAGHKQGIPTSQILTDLSDHVGKMTGISSNAKLGVTGARSDIERSIFFAPRYMKASIGLVADIGQGGIRGQLARESMAKMLAGGSLMYFGFATALGQEPQLDPTKPGFLDVEIAGTKVGFGSTWRSMAKTMGEAGALIDDLVSDKPDNKIQDQHIFTIDPRKNLLAKYISSKASPSLGLGWDIALGRDFMGEPVQPLSDPVNFVAKNVFAENMLPFWLQSWLPDSRPINPNQSIPSKFLQSATEATGLRSSPVSFFARRNAKRDALSAVAFNKKFDDLTILEKRYLNESDPELTQMNFQALQWGLQSTAEVDELSFKLEEDKDKAQTEKKRLLDINDEQWLEGEISAVKWRSQQSSTNRKYSETMKKLNDKEGIYGPAIAARDEYFLKNPSDLPQDEMYIDYIDQMIVGVADEFGNELYNEFGDMDYDAKQDREDSFVKKYGQEAVDDLMQWMGSTRDISSPRERYYQGKDLFSDYWAKESLIANQFGLTEVHRKYRKAKNTDEGDRILLENPALSKIETLANGSKEYMRKNSPALDAFLIQYGYVTSPMNATVKGHGVSDVRNFDFDPFLLPLD